MKKGSKLLATVFLAGGSAALLIAAFTTSDSTFRLFAQAPAARPESMDCHYYWQDLKYGFKDLYTTIKGKIDVADESVIPGVQKELDLYTWGTVTSKWLNDRNQVCMIIQSKNASGKDAAIQLTNCVNSISTYSVGNVVEVKYYPSSVSLAEGRLPQIGPLSQNNIATEVYLAYETNPAPVTVFDASRIFMTGYSTETAYHGLLRCYLEKTRVDSIDAKNSIASISSGKITVTVDYSGLNEHDTNDIYDSLNTAMTNERSVRVEGHQFAYYLSRDTNEMRLLVRSASDITL